jgi:hypothetical protein
MTLVAVGDYAASRRIAQVAGYRDVTVAFDVATLLRLAKKFRPAIIIVGTRLGLTYARAVERIPQLLRICPSTTVIVVTYSPTVPEVVELKGLEVFGYVDADDSNMETHLDRLIRRANDAGVSQRTRARRRQTH